MRLRLESYPHIGEIAARYGDMDANAHLNNLALEALHENARATMNRQLFPQAYSASGRRLRIVTSQNTAHFLVMALIESPRECLPKFPTCERLSA